jgi:hypothetical protein
MDFGRGKGFPTWASFAKCSSMAESVASARWPAWKRVPPFLPVPLRARADGWTPDRQARFIGFLAETGSVAEAARRVGLSRMAAYRLRRRKGADSFAHAWDAILGFWNGEPVQQRKVTPDELPERAYEGAVHIIMWRSKFVRVTRKPSNSMLLRHLRRMHAAARRGGWGW